MFRSQFDFNGVKGRLGATDVAELVDILSDANDVILERVSMNLDEAAGTETWFRHINSMHVFRYQTRC